MDQDWLVVTETVARDRTVVCGTPPKASDAPRSASVLNFASVLLLFIATWTLRAW
jgi:hypothetical protein